MIRPRFWKRTWQENGFTFDNNHFVIITREIKHVWAFGSKD